MEEFEVVTSSVEGLPSPGLLSSVYRLNDMTSMVQLNVTLALRQQLCKPVWYQSLTSDQTSTNINKHQQARSGTCKPPISDPNLYTFANVQLVRLALVITHASKERR